MLIVLFMEAREASNAQDKSRASHGGDGPPLQGHDGHMPSILANHPTSSGPSVSSGGNMAWDFTRATFSSGFMTVGDADTLWRPHFFNAVTFESQRSPELRPTARLFSNCGESREPVLRYSSRLLLLHCAAYPGISSHGVGLGFRRDRRGSTQVLQVYFAAVRDSLDVPGPCDCSSAIKPKVSAVCPSAITWASGASPSRCSSSISSTLFSRFLSWSRRR